MDYSAFSAAVSAEKVPATIRVARGANANPNTNPVATHWPMHKGRSRVAHGLWAPVPFTSSFSSAGRAGEARTADRSGGTGGRWRLSRCGRVGRRGGRR